MHFKYSDFDSVHLGRKIATAAVSKLDLPLIRVLRNELLELKCDLGFLKVDSLPRQIMGDGLAHFGLEFSDSKLEFERRLTPSDNLEFAARETPGFRISDELESVEIARVTLYEIADRSRFAFHFGSEQARQLYDHWLENLLSDLNNTRWKVATHLATGSVAGLIGTRISRASEAPDAHWEMVAVSSAFQGKGIGRALASSMLRNHREEGIDRVRVGTQADNRDAFLFYQSLGFRLQNTFQQFHLLPSVS